MLNNGDMVLPWWESNNDSDTVGLLLNLRPDLKAGIKRWDVLINGEIHELSEHQLVYIDMTIDQPSTIIWRSLVRYAGNLAT